MLLRLLLLFIVVPFVELALLLKLAELTGWKATLLLVVVTGVAGTLLAKSQGWRTYREIRHSLAEGRLPADSLIDAILIIVAGVMLLTPGILTDLLGVLLLIPLTRRFFRIWLVRWFNSRYKLDATFASRSNRTGESQIIDSYVVEQRSKRS